MARGAVRGALTAWLGLVVLQVAVTKGAGPLAGALDVANNAVKRALDPTVPAIPNYADRTRAAGLAAMPPVQTDTNYGSADAAERWTTPDPRTIPVPPRIWTGETDR